jgi:outer membrane protein OmpA-like peptidoglycan-associated protein
MVLSACRNRFRLPVGSTVFAVVFCLGIGLWATPAAAQSGIKEINVLNFEPSTSPYGIITVDTARTLGHLKWYVGGTFSYALDPFRFTVNSLQLYKFVHNQVLADVVLSMGFWHYFELGVHLPIVLYQDSTGDNDPFGAGDTPLGHHAVGDLRIVPKIRFWKNRAHGFGLALIPRFTVPSGLEKENAGDPFLTFEPRLVLDYTFKQGTVIALNMGYRLRRGTEVGKLRQDDEVFFGLGLEVPVYKRQLSLLAEGFGAFGWEKAAEDPNAGIDIEEFPLEVLGGIRYRSPVGLILTAGGGAGLTDGYGTPAFRVFLTLGYSPVPAKVVPTPPPEKDTDGDGILDSQDKCPKIPEDKDGFEDLDGCPDPDNDKDKICDNNEQIQKTLGKHAGICTGKDLCPDKPETVNKFEDEDGCPDVVPRPRVTPDVVPRPRVTPDVVPRPRVRRVSPRPRVVVFDGPMLETVIYFSTDWWRVRMRYRPLLKKLARWLTRHQDEATVIAVEGHADERGSNRWNKVLSYRRAQAVRRYLRRFGVPMWRMRLRALGKSQPVRTSCDTMTDNDAKQACMAKNRRVVFRVLKARNK